MVKIKKSLVCVTGLNPMFHTKHTLRLILIRHKPHHKLLKELSGNKQQV